MIGVLLLLELQNATALSAAYGIAVSGAMLVTTALAWRFLRTTWGLPALVATAALHPSGTL